MTSLRWQQWENFSSKVGDHIEAYTVPQYGDLPDDLASTFTIEEIEQNIARYLKRLKSNMRGPNERIRDCFKLAHYTCMLHALVMKEVADD